MGSGVHPILKRSLKPFWSNLDAVRAETNKIEVPEVENKSFEHKQDFKLTYVLSRIESISLNFLDLSLHEIQDHAFPYNLFFLRGDIIFPLGFNDAFTKILQSCAFRSWPAYIYDSIHFSFTFNRFRKLG